MADETKPIAFLSMGMVVLDELRLPSRAPLTDVAGGSGAYATLGARLTVPTAEASSVAYVLLVGDDFPAAILQNFQAWGLRLEVRRLKGQKSTRGLLQYHDEMFGEKSFRYTTPPLHLSPQDLAATPQLLSCAAFHFLAGPELLESRVGEVLAQRHAHGSSTRPLLVWEPSPLECRPQLRDAHLRASALVDVCSPNHLELMRLFNDDLGNSGSGQQEFSRSRIEQYAENFLIASRPLDAAAARPIVVIRAGEHGCLVVSRSHSCRWFPPYFEPMAAAGRVVDATGAGNCFLGAFARVFAHSRDAIEATIHGAVAASFAIEQIGLPTFAVGESGELWNNEAFQDRLNEYRARVA